MIALTHDAVTELNHRARTHLAAEGRPGETVARIEDTGTEYALGDTVFCLRNDRRLGVRNGDLATVIGATADGVVIERASERIELPASYLVDGHLGHGTPSPSTRPKEPPTTSPSSTGTSISTPKPATPP